MNSRPQKRLSEVLALEIGRTPHGSIELVISIPGRDGTSTRSWPNTASWDDVRAAVEATLSDWLWLTGGVEQQLPGIG